MATVYPATVFNDPKAWQRARRLAAHALDLVDGAVPPPNGAERSVSFLTDRIGVYSHGALGATSLNNFAALLREQGDLVGARPLYERAIEVFENVLGPEHPDTAASLNNLASLLQEQGDFAGARVLFERALAIREKVLGPQHSVTAATLNNLAQLLREQGDLGGARPLFERALAIDGS
jgi:tetratricopeptide (TPR) repeat protein